MASNVPEYIPQVSEIYSRVEALKWMQLMEWDLSVIDSIMYNDTPDLETMRRLVYRLGPLSAYECIKDLVEI